MCQHLEALNGQSIGLGPTIYFGYSVYDIHGNKYLKTNFQTSEVLFEISYGET